MHSRPASACVLRLSRLRPLQLGIGLGLALGFVQFARAQPVVTPVAMAPGGTIPIGRPVTLSVATTAPGATYQWRMNGVNLPGATGASYTLMAAGVMDTGSYDVVVTAGGASTTVGLGALTVAPTDARLINLSARGMSGAGVGQMIMGFVAQGTDNGATETVLLRGMGPSLATMMGGTKQQGNITLPNPMLTVYDNISRMMGSDLGWTGTPSVATGFGSSPVSATMQSVTSGMMSSLGAFPPTSTADAAMMMTAPAGNYTTVVGNNSGATGVVLAECYDATALSGGASTAQLMNMSARATVGTGEAVLIGGFVVTAGPSGAAMTVLLRAMGPTLSLLAVTDNLSAPTMTLYDGLSQPIASNANWTVAPTLATGSGASPVRAGIESATIAAMTKVGAFFPMAGAADAAMIATLPPGNYSVVVSGLPDKSGTPTTGVALLEIYEER